MSTSILKATVGKARVAPLTVDQYEAMIARGILPEGEPIELLDGLLMYKDRAAAGGKPMTVGPGHQCVINKLAELVTVIRRHGCHLAIQAPIRIPPDSEPEPDASIVAGAPGDFIRRHPGPSEVFCVIEVADSSLVHDRTVKHRLYASARIPQYVIVNLVDRRVEVYSNPRPARGRYKDATIRTRDQAVALSVGPGRKPVILRAKELLPYSGESVKR